MEKRTICHQPNQKAQVCNNDKGDGRCGDCDIALDWILKESEKDPKGKLKIFISDTQTSLRTQEHRPTKAKVSAGIFTSEITPSSPKQP